MEYNIYEIREAQDDNTINQLERNKIIIKSKYENMKIKAKNNGYRLWEYYSGYSI